MGYLKARSWWSIGLSMTAFLMIGISAPAYVQGLKASFEDNFLGHFNRSAMGTFLAEGGPPGTPPLTFIFNVYAEGMIRVSISTQGTTLTGFAFTDDQGVWKQTGKRQLTAAVLALNYLPPGTPNAPLEGEVHSISLARIYITYTNDFSRLSGEFDVNVYPPGTNPLAPDRDPILTIRFPFAGERLTVS